MPTKGVVFTRMSWPRTQVPVFVPSNGTVRPTFVTCPVGANVTLALPFPFGPPSDLHAAITPFAWSSFVVAAATSNAPGGSGTGVVALGVGVVGVGVVALGFAGATEGAAVGAEGATLGAGTSVAEAVATGTSGALDGAGADALALGGAGATVAVDDEGAGGGVSLSCPGRMNNTITTTATATRTTAPIAIA